MGASNPNGVILLKEDEFTTEDEIKVNPLGDHSAGRGIRGG